MKNIGIWIVLGLLALMTINGCNTYNGFVNSEEEVTNKWADVESEYQRRYDLIDNLVEVVKGVADFEKEVLTGVVEARASASSIKMTPEMLNDPKAMEQFQAAQGGLNSSLSRLLVTVENYPQLKATQNFLELQSQVEGTENRIKVARNKYNQAVTDYNILIRRFPAKLYAGMFGFEIRNKFEAEAGAEKAPKIKFGK